MYTTPFYVGIDIGKNALDVTCYGDASQDPQHKVFDTDGRGLLALRRWLQQIAGGGALRIAVEATGAYWLPVVEPLHASGWQVYVLNPRCIKDYARAENQRQKTDQVDAGVIARFLRARHPHLHPWSPPPPAIAALRELLVRWDQLGQSLQREYNRRDSIRDPRVRASLRRSISFLLSERRLMRDALARHCGTTPEVARDVHALTAEPGVGLMTAMRLVVLLRTHAFAHARQAAAYIGITPAHRQSGTSLRARPHISRVGDASLRHALYFPAIVAKRWHPVFKPWAAALLARGKSPKQTVCAVMRRLVHMAFGILRRIDREQPAIAA